MSLSDISSKNLGVIMKCLRTDPRHIDSLRKTCKSVNQQAVAMGLDKVNDVYLGLSIERIKNSNVSNEAKRKFEKYIIEIRAFIKNKRSDRDPECKACCTNIERPSFYNGWSDSEWANDAHLYGDDWTHASDSDNKRHKEDYPAGSGRKRKVLRRVRRLEADEDDNESDGSDYIKTHNFPLRCSCKVNNVDKLKIKCWRLNDEGINFLAQQSQLKYLRKLFLYNCNLDVKQNTFHQLIHSFPIKCLKINCKFSNYQLDNKALHNIDNVEITNVFGKSQLVYSGLTNDLLKYWEQTPPIEARFTSFETKFTLKGVIQLIQASIAKRSTASYILGIIRLSKQEYRILLNFMQKTRGLFIYSYNEMLEYNRPKSITIKYGKFAMNFDYKLTSE